MKIMKTLLLIVSLVLFLNIVDATSTYAVWQNTGNAITINNGEQAYFDFGIGSVTPPIYASIIMYDNANARVVKTFLQSTITGTLYTNRIFVAQADYLNTGSYTIDIRGTDSRGSTSSTLLTLTVLQATNNPVLNTIGNKIVNEGDLLQFTVTATDQNNDAIVLTTSTLPQGATFTDNGNGNALFSWTPGFTQAGNYVIAFTAIDSTGLSDSETITIIVNDVTAGGGPSLTIDEPDNDDVISGNYQILWTATDLDDQNLDVLVEYTYDGYGWFTLLNTQNNNPENLIWDTTQISDANDYQIRITITDDDGNQAIQTTMFIIDNQFNPTVTLITPSLNEVIFGLYNIQWNAVDLDQVFNTLDILIEIQNLAQNIQWTNLFNSQNNPQSFVWDTTQFQNGDYEFRLFATDNNGNTGTAYLSRFTINNPLNNAPIFTSTPITTSVEGQIYSYDANAVDPDNDAITYSLSQSPSGTVIDILTGLITWVPNTNQVGIYNIQVVATDARGLASTQLFTLNIISALVNKNLNENHKFSISNTMLKQENDQLNLYVNLDNKGNKREKIDLKVTIIKNGLTQTRLVRLDNKESNWEIFTFDNMPKDNYVIFVEADSNKFHDAKYAYTI